mmetsp:Transcript_15678/g.38646  ORF Transcript_15678/g.38646 Transcript_15678/m.38646 type:complete len:198 (+) Transcript_15678:88-681(+)
MGRFYCDYCDIYLTHDNEGGRRQHCAGRKHLENVYSYYNQLGYASQQELHQQMQANMQGQHVAGQGAINVTELSGGIPIVGGENQEFVQFPAQGPRSIMNQYNTHHHQQGNSQAIEINTQGVASFGVVLFLLFLNVLRLMTAKSKTKVFHFPRRSTTLYPIDWVKPPRISRGMAFSTVAAASLIFVFVSQYLQYLQK